MKFILGLGSNDGDRELHLQNALNFLAELSENLYFSTHYESPAMNGKDHIETHGHGQSHYLNSVAIMEFNGGEDQLNALLKQCESAEGRDDAARAEGRVPLDIDIVVADGNIRRPKDFSRFFFSRGYEELQSAIGPDMQDSKQDKEPEQDVCTFSTDASGQ